LSQVEVLRPNRVVFSHHDALLPPLLPATDTGEARSVLQSEASLAEIVDLDYGEPVRIVK
jgi:hypothetical protein